MLTVLNARNLTIMLFLLTLLFLITEPVFALNVEKIGQGVVGDQRIKMKWIKQYAFYFGIFFFALGVIVTVFRKRKFALQKRSDTHEAMGPFIIVIGCLLMLVKLF